MKAFFVSKPGWWNGRHAGLKTSCSLRFLATFVENSVVKKWAVKERIDSATFIEVCNTSKTMAEAASKLGLHFNSFKKRALDLKCYRPNQAGIGIRKKSPRIPLCDIIESNLFPHYQSFKLKIRLIKEGVKENVCEHCGISSWKGRPLSMELHHKDGKRNNHTLANLVLLCPNCHSQTETFRAKNRKI